MGIRRLLALALVLLLATGWTAALAEEVVSNGLGSIKIDAKHFPDKSFRELVKDEFDKNQDGKLSASERKAVKEVFTGGMSSFKSLKGIEYFPNLKRID